MKRLALLLAVVACVVVVVPVLWAQEGPAPGARERPAAREGGTRPGPRGMGVAATVERMSRVLDLSEEVKGKMAEIAKAGDAALTKWQEENAEALQKAQQAMRDAREKNDEAAMTKAREEMTALQQKRTEVQKKYEAQLLALLTAEQKAKWQETVNLDQVTRQLRGVRLTEEQQGKVKAIYTKAATGVKMDDEKAVAELITKVVEEVKKDVLTDEQRKQLQERPARGMRPEAGGGG